MTHRAAPDSTVTANVKTPVLPKALHCATSIRVDRSQIFEAFEKATDKQIEAIDLAADGLTSKQIALALGVVPRTIDQRVDALRIKLDGIPRNDLVRHYRTWKSVCGRTTYDPIPLTDPARFSSQARPQPETPLLFEDALTFDERSPWDRKASWLRPEIEPSNLGSGSRLLFIAVGAVLILVGVVLTAAFSNALTDLLSR